MGCIPTCMGERPTLIAMIFFTTAFFLVEIVVGYATNSMALVADSFHMLSDVISLFVGFFAIKISRQKASNLEVNTFGWVRAEVLGALINSVFLIALCFSIAVGAIKRLILTEQIEKPMLILSVGAAGLLVNLIGLLLFHGHAHGHSHSHGGHGHSHAHGHSHEKRADRGKITSAKQVHDVEKCKQIVEGKEHDTSHANLGYSVDLVESKAPRTPEESFHFELNISAHDDELANSASGPQEHKAVEGEPVKAKKAPKSSGQMNMKGVYLHVLGDALGSVIVIVAALIIYYCKGKWTLYVDPVMSLLMVVVILKSSIQLMKESSMILLQRTPPHIQLDELRMRLLGTFPQIIEVHEFHVWQLAGNKIVASLHIKFLSDQDYKSTSCALKEFFHDEGIHSTTVQPEFVESDSGSWVEKQCLLRCKSATCEEKLCCSSTPSKQLPEESGKPSSFASRIGSANDIPKPSSDLDGQADELADFEARVTVNLQTIAEEKREQVTV